MVNSVRERIYGHFRSLNYTLPNFIFSNEGFDSFKNDHANNFIDPACKSHPFLILGENNVLLNTEISHHATLGSHIFASKGTIGANAIIEDNVFMGIGSII